MGTRGGETQDMEIHSLTYTVLGKVTFKSNALQYCVTA